MIDPDLALGDEPADGSIRDVETFSGLRNGQHDVAGFGARDLRHVIFPPRRPSGKRKRSDLEVLMKAVKDSKDWAVMVQMVLIRSRLRLNN